MDLDRCADDRVRELGVRNVLRDPLPWSQRDASSGVSICIDALVGSICIDGPLGCLRLGERRSISCCSSAIQVFNMVRFPISCLTRASSATSARARKRCLWGSPSGEFPEPPGAGELRAATIAPDVSRDAREQSAARSRRRVSDLSWRQAPAGRLPSRAARPKRGRRVGEAQPRGRRRACCVSCA